ncbi:MAG: glycosyltransferase family 2 protein [Treponema sp.]|nr:glycosyltransferase family 2 protein [Treponema sp.]
MNYKTAVLIPCCNESKTIGQVVDDFRRVLPEADIYVYDNNSNDGTDRIAKERGAIVRHETRQGKGNVIRTMFREIFADCYILVDGDNTYPAESAPEMAHFVIEESADMVIGDRLSSTYFRENKRPFHNTGNMLIRRLVNAFFKGSATDIMTGYRAFSTRFVKTFPILSGGFEIETEMTIHALDKNLLIKSLPVSYRDRPAGSVSKLHTFTDGIKILIMIFNLFRCYKPLCFFGAAALILVLLAVIFFMPVLADYVKTGLVPKFPTFIGSGILAIFSLQSFVCGLILDSIAKIEKKNFELQMSLFIFQNEKTHLASSGSTKPAGIKGNA